MQGPPLRSISLAIALLAAACGGAPSRGQRGLPADALRIDGQGRLVDVAPMGLEHLQIDLFLHNPGGPRRLTRAVVLLASEGGWAFSLGDPMDQRGSLFGMGPELAADKELRARLSYWWSAPISLFFLRVDSLDKAGAPQASMVQIPVGRSGFTPPPRLLVSLDGYISLQEPVEIVPLSNSKRWLALTGQVVNVTGRPITLDRWRMVVKDEGGQVILDGDLGATFHIVNDASVVVPFLYGIDVPAGVSGGSITINAEATVARGGGERWKLTREAQFAAAAPMRITPPLAGTWIWNNGPGQLVPHTHTPWPEQRYAYDLSVVRVDAGRRSTFEGDPDKNESFFAWDQPIRAAADGTVVEVVDNVPDNFGRTENPANASKQNARVVLRHAEERYTVYAHLRQGSAKVVKGQTVKAGEELGRVGNAGFSSEPHLHFACFRIDRTGRVQALPIEPMGLKTVTGEEVRGVPVGGALYWSE